VSVQPASTTGCDELLARADESGRVAFDRRLRLFDCFERSLPPQLSEQLVLPGELQPLGRERVLEFWDRLLKQHLPARALHLIQFYLHVPFCRTKCRFCQFPSETVRESTQPERFVVSIEREMNAFKSSLGAVSVDCLAIGGGTPSLLSKEQLERLLRATRSLVTFPQGTYFSVECNPDSTTRALVDVLADYGVTRVSLGVQSFDTEVLRQMGRAYQTEAQVIAAANAVRQRQLALSLDLIAPLPGETVSSFAAGVDRALDLNPDMIVLYWFQPPGSGAYSPLGTVFDRGRAREILLRAASRARYDVLPQTGPSLVLKRAGAAEPATRYQQRRSEPSSTYGFGPYAWSHVAGVGAYMTEAGVDGALRYRGVALDHVREARAAVIRSFETRQIVERTAFRDTFGQDAVAMLPAEIAYLSEARRVTVTDRIIRPEFSDPRDARRHSWVLFDRAFLSATIAEAILPQQRAAAAAIARYEKVTGGAPRPRVRELQRHLQSSIAPIETNVCVWHAPAQLAPNLEVWLEPLDLEPLDRARTLVSFHSQFLSPALQPIVPIISELDACRGLYGFGVDIHGDTDTVSLRLRFAAPPSRWLASIEATLSIPSLAGVSPELLSKMAELRLGIGRRGAIRREGVFLLNSSHAGLRNSRDRVSARLLAQLAEAGSVVSWLRSDMLAALEIEVPAAASAVLRPILDAGVLKGFDLGAEVRCVRLRIPVLGDHLDWHCMAVATVA